MMIISNTYKTITTDMIFFFRDVFYHTSDDILFKNVLYPKLLQMDIQHFGISTSPETTIINY